MKIDRRGFIAASSSALVLAKSQLSAAARGKPSEPAHQTIEGREITVYTTADKTNRELAAFHSDARVLSV